MGDKLKSISRPGIRPETLESLGIRHVDSAQAKELCGIAASGIWIPFSKTFDLGKPYGRLRLAESYNGRKYHQQSGSNVHAYIPECLAPVGGDLVIVEGEFKAICLNESGIPAVGISGFFGWGRKTNDQWELLPEVLQLIEGKNVTRLLFLGDSDTSLNWQFCVAAIALTKAADIPVVLPRIRLDAPGKGVDDVKATMTEDAFCKWWQSTVSDAIVVETDASASDLAVELLSLEKQTLQTGSVAGFTRTKLVNRIVGIEANLTSGRMPNSIEDLVKKIIRPKDLQKAVERLKAERHSAKLEESAPKILEQFAFDGRRYYRHLEKTMLWGSVERSDAMLIFDKLGHPRTRPKNATRSPAEELLLRVQAERRVEYAGPLCGRSAGFHEELGRRFLATRSPVFIEGKLDPKPGPLYQFFCDLFGGNSEDQAARQMALFMGWIKLARIALRNPEQHLPGQALGLIGPQNCGKTFAQSWVTKLLGGRESGAGHWMTGLSDFNSELWTAEHLTISDENLDPDGRMRRMFRDRLKGIVANETYTLAEKYKTNIQLRPIWRLSISANDNADSATIIPNPFSDATIADKVILFKCFEPPQPFPTASNEERASFKKSLTDDLPNFAGLCDQLDISGLAAGRFGIRHYVHPDLETMLRASDPDSDLTELIQKFLETHSRTSGTASEIYKSLENFDHWQTRHASKNPKHLGHQLRRLAENSVWRNRIRISETKWGANRHTRSIFSLNL